MIIKKKTWQHFCKVLKGPKLFQHFSFEAKKIMTLLKLLLGGG